MTSSLLYLLNVKIVSHINVIFFLVILLKIPSLYIKHKCIYKCMYIISEYFNYGLIFLTFSLVFELTLVIVLMGNNYSVFDSYLVIEIFSCIITIIGILTGILLFIKKHRFSQFKEYTYAFIAIISSDVFFIFLIAYFNELQSVSCLYGITKLTGLNWIPKSYLIGYVLREILYAQKINLSILFILFFSIHMIIYYKVSNRNRIFIILCFYNILVFLLQFAVIVSGNLYLRKSKTLISNLRGERIDERYEMSNRYHDSTLDIGRNVTHKIFHDVDDITTFDFVGKIDLYDFDSLLMLDKIFKKTLLHDDIRNLGSGKVRSIIHLKLVLLNNIINNDSKIKVKQYLLHHIKELHQLYHLKMEIDSLSYIRLFYSIINSDFSHHYILRFFAPYSHSLSINDASLLFPCYYGYYSYSLYKSLLISTYPYFDLESINRSMCNDFIIYNYYNNTYPIALLFNQYEKELNHLIAKIEEELNSDADPRESGTHVLQQEDDVHGR